MYRSGSHPAGRSDFRSDLCSHWEAGPWPDRGGSSASVYRTCPTTRIQPRAARCATSARSSLQDLRGRAGHDAGRALRQRTRTDEATEVSRSRTAITTVGRKRTEVIGLRLTGATRSGCADDVARGSWSGCLVKVSILSRIYVSMALLDMWLAWLMLTTGCGCATSARLDRVETGVLQAILEAIPQAIFHGVLATALGLG